MSIQIEGLDQIARAVAELKRRTDGGIANQVVLEAAEIVRDEYRRTAPIGPTGNLRRSAQAFVGRRAMRLGAYAIAWLKFRMAPEAPLVEFGTDERFPKGRALKIPINRMLSLARGINTFIFAKHVAAVPPNPIFEHAVEHKAQAVLDHVVTREKELIEGVGH